MRLPRLGGRLLSATLAEIRDSRLYRIEFKTFETYCQERWGWGRDYANKLIQASAVVSSLPAGLDTIVCKEGHARELAKAPEEERAAVIDEIR